MEQNPKEGKCKSSDGKSYTSSPIAETVAEFNHKVGGSGLDKVQNQEVTVDRSLEDVSQTAVRKRKSKGKKRADQDNTDMEQNPKEGECISSDWKTCTSSPSTETVAKLIHKVSGNGLDKVQNQEVTVDKSLENASQRTVRKRKSKGKKRADQDNTNMEQNPKEGKCKSSDGKSYTSSPIAETVAEFNHKVGGNGLDKVQNQEVTVDRSLEDVSQTAVRKRKSKGKKRADQDNTDMEQNPKEGDCISSDWKTCTSSPSTETVAKFIHKVSGNGLDKVQNQEVTVNKNLLESGCIGVSFITNTKQLELENSIPERAPHIRRKLLILDLNGLLVGIVSSLPHGYQADNRVAKKALLKRPFCDDFLKFCFQRFRVGVWSSRTRRNVDTVVDYIMADFRHELLFCWDQSHCTTTGFYTLADRHKPLVLKELRKLWDKHVPSLPWEKGEYNESNTLLLDDSPYKALLNPPHTAIFPVSYKFQNSNDNSLAPGGDLRMYLEGLAIAENVQKYIEQHHFGQGSITKV